jgi:HAD superfamily hydrolase (TIGR01549 family)
MIKAIIFDCFGVVINETLESAYRNLGGDFEKDLEKIDEIRWKSDKGEIPRSAPYFAEMLGVSESTWVDEVASGRVVNQALLDYIQNELKKVYKIAMLSNVGKNRLPQIFGKGFLEKYFELIITSGDIGFAKPEPEAYEIVASKLGVRLDECVFTDDRQDYIDGAQGVGMKTILFKNAEQFIRELELLL